VTCARMQTPHDNAHLCHIRLTRHILYPRSRTEPGQVESQIESFLVQNQAVCVWGLYSQCIPILLFMISSRWTLVCIVTDHKPVRRSFGVYANRRRRNPFRTIPAWRRHSAPLPMDAQHVKTVHTLGIVRMRMVPVGVYSIMSAV
jgi:hypothetical protein